MQQDLFVEKIVKCKRRGIERLLAVMLILSACFLILIAYFIPILLQQDYLFISTIVSCGIVYLTYRLVTGLNREYEYSITNDDLNIDKIIAQRKRTNMFKGSCKDFTVFAPVSELTNEVISRKTLLHLDLRSGVDSKAGWYFITKSNQPTLILFEPDDRFISAVKRYNPRAFYKL